MFWIWSLKRQQSHHQQMDIEDKFNLFPQQDDRRASLHLCKTLSGEIVVAWVIGVGSVGFGCWLNCWAVWCFGGRLVHTVALTGKKTPLPSLIFFNIFVSAWEGGPAQDPRPGGQREGARHSGHLRQLVLRLRRTGMSLLMQPTNTKKLSSKYWPGLNLGAFG